MEQNPYQAPSSEITNPTAANADAEAIRKEYINHETNVKSIGTLYFLGGLIFIMVFLVMLTSDESRFGKMKDQLQLTVIGGALVVLLFGLGFGLRNLKRWVRIPTILLAAIGLLGFPIGTIINAYILYLVGGKKGQMVFSEEYQQVIAATPHVKYKSSLLSCFLLLLLIFAVVGLITYFASRR